MLVYEAEPSLEFWRREEEVARLEELNGPPAVDRPNYQWPKKLLLRKKSSNQEPTQPGETGIVLGEVSAYMVFTNPRSEKRFETHREILEPKPFVMAPLSTGENWSANDEPRSPEMSEDREESQSVRESTQPVPENENSEPEVVSRSVIGGGEPAQKEPGRDVQNLPVPLPPEPMAQLQEELARCMRLGVDFSGDAEVSQLASPEPNSDPKVGVEVDTVSESVSISEAAVPFTPEARIFMVTRSQTRTQDVVNASGNANEADDRDVGGGISGIPEQQNGNYSPDAATPVEHITERWRRIFAQQQAEPWTKRLRDFLKGDLEELSPAEAEDVAKLANQFVLDSRGALYYLSRPTPGRPWDAAENLRLVVPAGLREDLLYLCHEDFQGGHQGITRTFERLRREYYWLGMYADVERFVKECVDCVTATDAALLPEDVFDPDEDRDVYEVEAIQDIRWVKRTRTSRRAQEYLVKWKGYSDSEWLPVSQLNCGVLLYDFTKSARAQSRFRAMLSGDDPSEPSAQ
ncbi:hypothetical protein PF010_g21612 [Phytophthora fragariae]|uniref:Chromo domain-containing protein n=1 Tax=Phytophthora fragariae TaxID=53985 RepID=A0A6G0MUB4_9STRA|nr:hypothetical protein PF010_g21612 [Phytophthora fragariae]KAE9181901.1 hypothetical protein PF004_g24400 [Phytophthora fragariae]